MKLVDPYEVDIDAAILERLDAAQTTLEMLLDSSSSLADIKAAWRSVKATRLEALGCESPFLERGEDQN